MAYQYWSYETLHRFCTEAFQKFGFNEKEADIIQDVLLTSDLFGIESHGMQRMVRYHKCIEKGMITTMEMDFMVVSSYGSGTVSSKELTIKKDLSIDICGRDVLLIEDIIDSGNTLYRLKQMLLSRNPASLSLVTLLDKPERREVPVQPDYTGFVIEDEFVIGYGLDYAEEYRNLPYVGVLKRSVYEK